MDTRIYTLDHAKPVRGSVAFDYRGWIISLSTVGGICAEVLIWESKDDSVDMNMKASGIDGIFEAVNFIDSIVEKADNENS